MERLALSGDLRIQFVWNVNATPLLTAVAAALGEVGLEAILIGNAAAALPLAKRMNFLRVRLPGGGSHL